MPIEAKVAYKARKIYRLNNLIAKITSPAKNNKIEMRLMPCMYLTHCVLGVLGSFFLRYKYCAIWFQMLMGIILYC